MPGFESLPNEMLNAVFEQLSDAQRYAIKRTCYLWNEVMQDLLKITAKQKMPTIDPEEVGEKGLVRLLAKQKALKREIKETFPFLLSKGDKRDPIELEALLRKEKLIYENLWSNKKYPFTILFGNPFRELFACETTFSDYSPFSEKEQVFLRVLGAASGVVSIEENAVDLEQVFKMAAVIGNKIVLSALKEKEISFATKEFAFKEAAKKGHLACVIYLNEQYGTAFSNECKERACNLALEGPWLDCFDYLNKQYRSMSVVKEKSSFDDVMEDNYFSTSPNTRQRTVQFMLNNKRSHNTVRRLTMAFEETLPAAEVVVNDEVRKAIQEMDMQFRDITDTPLSPLKEREHKKRGREEDNQNIPQSPIKKRLRMHSPQC